MQIRRILISSNNESSSRRTRSRYPKIQTAIDDQFRRFKRSYSVEQPPTASDDQTATPTTDEGYRSGSSATKKRNNPRLHRSTSSVVRIFIKIRIIFTILFLFVCYRMGKIILNLRTNDDHRPKMMPHTTHWFIPFEEKEDQHHHHPHQHLLYPKNLQIFLILLLLVPLLHHLLMIAVLI